MRNLLVKDLMTDLESGSRVDQIIESIVNPKKPEGRSRMTATEALMMAARGQLDPGRSQIEAYERLKWEYERQRAMEQQKIFVAKEHSSLMNQLFGGR